METMQNAQGLLSAGTLVAGVVVLVSSTVLMVRKLLSQYDTTPWMSIMVMTLFGGVLIMTPSFIRLAGTAEKKKPSASPAPSPSETPTPTSSPTSSPENTADPITLPKIENASSIFIIIGIILAAVLVLFFVYLISRRLHRDLKAQKKQRELEQALEKRLTEKWKSFTDKHTALRQKVLKAETDWEMLFSYPSLTDVSSPTTAALYKAMKAADAADPTRPSSIKEDTDLTALAYPKKVMAFGHAWDVALTAARKVGQDGIPPEERKIIRQIKEILRKAEDTGATEHERVMAYNRAHSMIKKLKSIQVPEKALLTIEEKKRLMIEEAKPVTATTR